MEEEEIWEPTLKGGEFYSISNYGRIMTNKTGKIRKPFVNTRGYLACNLSFGESGRKTFLVHRLVCESFLPNPEKKRTVNHKDGDKHNNLLSNLEWATHSENAYHAYEIGLKVPNT